MVSIEGLVDIDLKSASVVVSTIPVNVVGSAVPSNMKRWITYIKATNKARIANELYLCSSSASNIASSSISKDRVSFSRLNDMVGYPENLSPLFSIASTNYLTAITDKGAVNVFVQYYDS